MLMASRICDSYARVRTMTGFSFEDELPLFSTHNPQPFDQFIKSIQY